jgi:hypothetical protein
MKLERVDEYIIEKYPQPIARAWQAVLEAQTPAERVRLLLDGALCTIGRFLAALLLAERLAKPDAKSIRSILREVRVPDDPLRTTWRTVWSLLQDSKWEEQETFFPRRQLWTEDTAASGLFEVIEHLVERARSLRNGTGEFSPRSQQKAFEECLPRVRAVLNRLAWLVPWPLIEVTDISAPSASVYEGRFKVFRGADRPTELRAPCLVKFEPGRVYIHRHDGSVLSLWPWVQTDPTMPLDEDRLAFFDAVEGHRIVCARWDSSRLPRIESPTLAAVLRESPRPPLNGPPIYELYGHQFDPAPRFKVIGKIGQGGMGIVEVAHDLELPREVALKRMPGWVSLLPSLWRRFTEEAEIQAQLRHPNIMRVEVFRTCFNEPFIIMERCRETLAGRIRTLAVTPVSFRCKVALDLAEKLLDALRYLHERGYAHLDIKPSNVLFGQDGVPMLADFGLARQTREGGVVVPTDQYGATLLYAPPEQLAGRPSSASDVFALAVTLDEIVTGAPTKNAGESVPEPLGRLLRAMARQDPSQRLRAAEALAQLRLLRGPLPPPPVKTTLRDDLTAPLNEFVAARLGAALRRHLESGASLPTEVAEHLEARSTDEASPLSLWNALRRKHLALVWPHRRDAMSLADLIEACPGRWSPSALRAAVDEIPMDPGWTEAIHETRDGVIVRGKGLHEVWGMIPAGILRHEAVLACMSPGEGVLLDETSFVREALRAIGQPEVADMPRLECWAVLNRLLLGETYERRAQRKRGGGIRWIHVPTPRLRSVQSVFARMLARCLPASPWSVGFTPARSTAFHARAHAGARAAVVVDIHDYFGSIRPIHILPRALPGYDPSRLHLDPGSRIPTNPLAHWSNLGLAFIILYFFIGHTTRESQFLPQGAPSSPVLANLAGSMLDCHIRERIAEGTPDRSAWTYSRYADDLVISSRSGGHTFHEAAEKTLMAAIDAATWTASPNKVRHWSSLRGAALVLCGVTVPGSVDGDLTLPREAARTVRAAFHRAKQGDVTRTIRGTLAYAYAMTGRHSLIAVLPGKVQKQVRALSRAVAPGFSSAFFEGWLTQDTRTQR